MRSFPALIAFFILSTLCISVWLQAEPPTPPSKTTVLIDEIEHEVTQNPDGSASVSLRNRPFCIAATRTNSEGETEVRCLSTPQALENYLSDELDTNNQLTSTKK